MSNWCWGEDWFKFSSIRNKVKKLPLVNIEKLDSCYIKIEEKACNPHDDKFELWGGIYDFLKANKEFATDVITILHWTTTFWRLSTFLLLFWGTSTLWIKYFNWTCVWKRLD